MEQRIAKRNQRLRRSHVRLPGRVPYDNLRPINVPGRFDGRSLFECLCELHPHVSSEQWRESFALSRILLDDQAVQMHRIVRGGEQYWHLFPNTVEPDVDAGIQILWEDDAMLAVHKPAPLPVHPCGRFNRNTLTSMLGVVYRPEDLRLVHRLDANTTGVLLLARNAETATRLRRKFQNNEIEKTYLAMCAGHPAQVNFTCNEPIARTRGAAGTRMIDPRGNAARTDFRLLQRLDCGRSLIEASPVSGRTNQIRIHLWSLGLPVVGDPAYLTGNRLAASQTLSTEEPPMCLHAAGLTLTHPVSKELVRLVAPRPGWLRDCDLDA